MKDLTTARADQLLLGQVARRVLSNRRLFFFDGQREISHGLTTAEGEPGCCVLGTVLHIVEWTGENHRTPVYRLTATSSHAGPCRAAGWRVKELFS